MIHRIEKLHNKISDSPLIWFPFLCLKPRPDQNISFSRKLLMTLCFSLYAHTFHLLKSLLFNHLPTLTEVIQLQFILTAVFFLWFSFVTQFFWNRRANRL